MQFYFAYDSAESQEGFKGGSTEDKAKLMTESGQFGTACIVLGLSFVVFALYEPPIILEDP